MPSRQKPIELIVHEGKSHMTKEQIEERRAQEVKAPSDAVLPPSYLDKKLQKKFTDISGQLIKLGIMSNLDCDALARYLQSEKNYLKYDKLLGQTMSKGASWEKSVELLSVMEKLENLRDKAFKQCRGSASDLGLTISSRCKLVIPKTEVKKDVHASMFGDEYTG